MTVRVVVTVVAACALSMAGANDAKLQATATTAKNFFMLNLPF
ncbi:hypothetical protein [Lichenihabitans psoromatis]|nr:hypothetical protein [Lichenihabitans psoromatis]